MDKVSTCLWFNGTAEEAANFYISLFPDSRIDRIMRAPLDNPGTGQGDVLFVEFTLAGRRYSGLNGGPNFPLTEAVSLVIDCADQKEVDYFWDALIADGGSESECGWCRDRFGLSWQVTPSRLIELMNSSDRATAERVMGAMMTMRKIDIAALEAAVNG